jgi:hypothetical protein
LPPQPTDIRSWLEQLDCRAHLQAFLNAGYDQLPFLHSLERSDYAEFGIDNPQLQTKLAASLMQIDKVKVKCGTQTGLDCFNFHFLSSSFSHPFPFQAELREPSSVEDWLEGLKLSQYKENVLESGTSQFH